MQSENKNSDEQYEDNLCQLEGIIDKYEKEYILITAFILNVL